MKAAFVISMIVFYLLGVVVNIERVNYIHLRYRLPYLTHLNLLLLCYLSWLIHLTDILDRYDED